MDLGDIYGSQQTPVENKQVGNLYNLLYSLAEALSPDITSLNLRDGSGERFNGYIDELIQATNDIKLNDFKLDIRRDHKGKPWTSGEEYSRQLVGIVKYLYKTNDSINYYGMALPDIKFPKYGGGGNPTTINNHLSAEQSQDNQQTTTVTVEFTQTIMSLAETLTNLERDFPDRASKENKFAKALKDKLPTVKNTLDIMSLVLKIADQVGLNPQNILKLLNLS